MTESQSPIDTNCITLSRYLMQQQRTCKSATGNLTQLMIGIQTSVKAISSAVRKAGIAKLYGISGETNVQGEEVKKLDVYSNELFINMLKSSFTTCALVSEENDEYIICDSSNNAKYIVSFDPLDGSSNIDCMGSIGSIFAIYKRVSDAASVVNDADILQNGRKIVAAGYALYGSATVMVLSVGNGVHGFTLDPAIGEFVLTHKDIQVPSKGKIYSINEGYESMWSLPVAEYVRTKKYPENGKPYGARYIGSMVGDVHRTFMYGGIFMYPSTKAAPEGKLRVLYECFPMAFLMEQAGGKASDGTKPILDINPKSIHQRSPIFLGSKEDVDELLSFISKYKST